MKRCPECSETRLVAIGEAEVAFDIDSYGSPISILNGYEIFPPDEFTYECLDCGWTGDDIPDAEK